jgi:predicted nucleic-acid-binding Zn-ribbon protein
MNAESVTINGKQLKCNFCGNTQFLKSNIRMNTWGTTFGSGFLSFFAKRGRGYICSDCGLLHEFYKEEQ